MTLIARELQDSRRVEGDLVSPRRGYRSYRVWDDSDDFITPTIALGASGVPVRGDPHPSNGDLRADSIRSQMIVGDPNMVELEWEYVPTAEFYPGPGPGQDGYLVPLSTSDVQLRPIFRAEPGVASLDGFGNVIPASRWNDIGGTVVDVNGFPTSWPQPLIQYEVLEHRAGPIDDSEFIFTGFRNSTVFLGIIIGKLMYVGTRTSAIGPNMFSLVHSFLADRYYHCVQVPLRDQRGEVATRLVSGTQPPATVPPQREAFPVVWRQLFINLFDFHNLSPHFSDL